MPGQQRPSGANPPASEGSGQGANLVGRAGEAVDAECPDRPILAARQIEGRGIDLLFPLFDRGSGQRPCSRAFSSAQRTTSRRETPARRAARLHASYSAET